ncbi:hypothetical protein RSAG8_13982, partial [Rhizoctonia solani AG-8 WAC10335]
MAALKALGGGVVEGEPTVGIVSLEYT